MESLNVCGEIVSGKPFTHPVRDTTVRALRDALNELCIIGHADTHIRLPGCGLRIFRGLEFYDTSHEVLTGADTASVIFLLC